MLNLVQNDTGPDIEVTVCSANSNLPVNFSNSLDTVRLKFKREDGTGTLRTIVGTKPNGGADGKVKFVWPAGALALTGMFEAEVEITFANGKVQTVPEKLRFFIREEIV